jgi:hypothetical protein
MGTSVEVAESLAAEAVKKRKKLVPVAVDKPAQTGKNNTRTQKKPTNSGTSPRA